MWQKEPVFYLTRVKVKVVRIARRVKIKYVIKGISPVLVGLSPAGEGGCLIGRTIEPLFRK